MASSSSSTEAVPPWVELPPELTEAILHKLGTVEILMTAPKVCTTWRRVCQDPAMRRRIHIPKRADLEMFLDLNEIWRRALDLIRGLLADFNNDCNVSNGLLIHIIYGGFSMCIQNWVAWRGDLEMWRRTDIPKRADLEIGLEICRRAMVLIQGLLTDIECDVSNDLLLYIIHRRFSRGIQNWLSRRADLEKWQRIDIPKRADFEMILDLGRICRRAVDLSQGQLTDINIECYVSDDLLLYISQRSSQLRRLQLRLPGCRSGDALQLAVKSLPLLEELHLYLDYCGTTIFGSDVENVGLSLPLLKSFRLNGNLIEHNYDTYDEEALAIAESMPQLRQLQLVGNLMTDKGLKAILDCCPHLESLDLRQCTYVLFAGDLKRLCSERIKDLRLPNDPMDDYPFPEDFKVSE